MINYITTFAITNKTIRTDTDTIPNCNKNHYKSGITPLDITISYQAMERRPGHSWPGKGQETNEAGSGGPVHTEPLDTYSVDWQSCVALVLSLLKITSKQGQ